MDRKVTLNAIKDFKKSQFVERSKLYTQRVIEKLDSDDVSLNRFLDCASYEVLSLHADSFSSFKEYKRYTKQAVDELLSRGFKVKTSTRCVNSRPITYSLIIFGW